MKLLRTVFLASCALACFGAASAQEVPAGFMQDLPFSYRGNVLGMPAWTLPDNDLLFMVGPDGKTVLTGYVFDTQGEDIGSILTGTPPVNVWESLRLDEVGAAEDAGAIPASIEPAVGEGATLTPPETGLMTFPESVVAALAESQGKPVEVGVPAIAPANPATTDPATTDYAKKMESGDPSAEDGASVEAIMSEARTSLEGLTETEKRDLLIDLVQRIDQAKSPQEFQLSLIEWNERVQGRKLISDEQRAALAAGGTPETPAPADMAPAVAAPVDVAPVKQEVNAEPAKKDGKTFLEEMRKEAFWFAVGDKAAPAVYAFIDPTCPYCAKAMANLQPDVEGGKIQLRVILAPLVSKQAPDAIAGILLSDDIGKTFWEHEQKKARFGSSDLKPQPFSDLPAGTNAALKTNFDMVVENELPGVPFFGWEGDEGPEFFSGVPEAGRFSDARVDPFNGTN